MCCQSCRGKLRLCKDVTSEEGCFVEIPWSVLSSGRVPCEVCVLYALQTLLALHSTLYLFDRTVVHLEIFRSCCRSGSRSEMEPCLWILLPPSCDMRFWCFPFLTISWFSAIVPFVGILDLRICWRFPSALRLFMELSNCKSLSEIVLGRWIVSFTIATVTHSCSDSFPLPLPFWIGGWTPFGWWVYRIGIGSRSINKTSVIEVVIVTFVGWWDIFTAVWWIWCLTKRSSARANLRAQLCILRQALDLNSSFCQKNPSGSSGREAPFNLRGVVCC